MLSQDIGTENKRNVSTKRMILNDKPRDITYKLTSKFQRVK
jgi:hypothetical protein